MDENINKLIQLYSKESKHSGYQILSERLSRVLPQEYISIKSKYEKERLHYILGEVDIENKTILDIGGNTGYFTFELIDNGAKRVHYYEGNKSHSEFVDLSSRMLNVDDKIRITSEYFDFENISSARYDIALVLNILHHLGDDFGDASLNLKEAKKGIIRQMNNMANVSEIMIFQMGFNWKGNRYVCLFENGTKEEMIEFIEKGTESYWEILKIGVPEKVDDKIIYMDVNDENIKRRDELGEFLNRPIFIMKSKIFNK